MTRLPRFSHFLPSIGGTKSICCLAVFIVFGTCKVKAQQLNQCSRELTRTVPNAEVALTELAHLRVSIDKAKAEGSKALALTLARNFKVAAQSAADLGISLFKLNDYIHRERLLVSSTNEDESARSSLAEAQEYRFLQFKQAFNLPLERQIVHPTQFSPDSSLILTYADDEVALWDSETGHLKQKFSLRQGLLKTKQQVASAAFSDDGSMVIASNRAGGYSVWSVTTGALLKRINLKTSERFPQKTFVLGKYIVTLSNESKLSAYDAETSRFLFDFPISVPGLVKVSASADGSKFVTLSSNRQADIWDTNTGEHQRNVHHNFNPVDAKLSPDGSYLTLASVHSGTSVWDTNTGEKIGLVTSGYSSTFDSTGENLLLADVEANQLELVSVRSLKVRQKMQNPDSTPLSASESPNGRHLVIVEARGIVRVYTRE